MSECGPKATPTAWKPSEPKSACSLLSISASCRQWELPMNRNSTTTTLPLKLDNNISSPDGLVMDSSGDLRGAGAWATNEEAASAMETITELNLRSLIV